MSEKTLDNHIQELMEAVETLKKQIAPLKIKADKWDVLDKKIAKFYPGDDEEEGGDLLDIGETAAAAFGYL